MDLLKQGYSLNTEELRSKFPYTVAKIEKWFIENEHFQKNMALQGIDIADFSILTKFVDMIITYDPRKLYDVFDSLGCRIFILSHPDGSLSEDVDPTNFLFYNNIKKESKSAATRVEAEYHAFTDAFELLNN